MRREVTEIRVFVSSPADVADERRAVKEAVETVDRTLGKVHPLVIRPVLWEDDTRPAAGNRLQEVIKEQLETDSIDIYVGILANRLGTPTGAAPSGTVEEFEDAHKLWKERKRPSLMFYFLEAPVEADDEAQREAQEVRAFRDHLQKENLLYGQYQRVDEFKNAVHEHLFHEVVDLMGLVDAKRSGQDSPLPETDAPAEDEDGEIGADLIQLRLNLEMKLAWLCKHLLAGPDTATYATIGSLSYDGYLTPDQAQLATRVMSGRPGSQKPELMREFAASAEKTIASFRATVFDPFVRKMLEEDGWTLEDFDQKPGHRPDFLADKGGRTFRIAPRFITAEESQIRVKTVRRLEAADDAPRPVDATIVAIPDASGTQADGPEADPRVVKLADLLKVLNGA